MVGLPRESRTSRACSQTISVMVADTTPKRARQDSQAARISTAIRAGRHATQGPHGADHRRQLRNTMTRTIGVALLGLGNVGGGVVKLLEDNAAAILARLGAKLEVRAIAVRDLDKTKRVVDVARDLLTTDV